MSQQEYFIGRAGYWPGAAEIDRAELAIPPAVLKAYQSNHRITKGLEAEKETKD